MLSSTTATRRPGTSRQGNRFSEATVEAVWNKARTIPGANASARRMDRCGAIIDRSAYGSTTENGTGWEIDHIRPVARGGTDDLNNLQPLQWQNNRAKGDSYPPNNYCVVQAAK